MFDGQKNITADFLDPEERLLFVTRWAEESGLA